MFGLDTGPLILVGCVAFMVLLGLVLLIVRIARAGKGKKALAELQGTAALDMRDKARLAIYSAVDTMDGKPLTPYRQLVGRKKSAFMDATLVLVPPGAHTFAARSAQTGAAELLSAVLEAGHTYQIGANDDGNYIEIDDADYVYKRVLPSKATAAAGIVNQ